MEIWQLNISVTSLFCNWGREIKLLGGVHDLPVFLMSACGHFCTHALAGKDLQLSPFLHAPIITAPEEVLAHQLSPFLRGPTITAPAEVLISSTSSSMLPPSWPLQRCSSASPLPLCSHRHCLCRGVHQLHLFLRAPTVIAPAEVLISFCWIDCTAVEWLCLWFLFTFSSSCILWLRTIRNESLALLFSVSAFHVFLGLCQCSLSEYHKLGRGFQAALVPPPKSPASPLRIVLRCC